MGEYGHGSTQLQDLPDVILVTIFSLVGGTESTRSRNSMSLVSRRWRQMERSTRTSITLRGSSADLYRLPTCFPSITHLDISLLSPWGCSLRHPYDPTRHLLSAALLQARFPLVTHLTAYARYREDLAALSPCWPDLRHAKLVRWHSRPQEPTGSDLEQLFWNCPDLESLDLSSFYSWTEDIPAALQAYPASAARLVNLNLLSQAAVEGFKTPDIVAIADLCPNLQQLMVSCTFDPRYDDSVGDDALVALATKCRRLRTLHLVEYSAVSNPRGGSDGDGDGLGVDGVQEQQAALQDDDSRITQNGLEALATGLPELEDLALDVCHTVRGAGPALEWLGRRCPRLKSLRVGRFQSVCRALALHLDGVSVCGPLSSLCIKECFDLTDVGVAAIARGCSRLSKVAIVGCPGVTGNGVEKMARALRKTLVDVEVSRCAQLDTRSVLKALEPLRRRIVRLHVDCVWREGTEEQESDAAGGVVAVEDGDVDGYDGNDNGELWHNGKKHRGNGGGSYGNGDVVYQYDSRSRKRIRTDGAGSLSDMSPPSTSAVDEDHHSDEDGEEGTKEEEHEDLDDISNCWGLKTWPSLRHLSVWVPVGVQISPLIDDHNMLADCPTLSHISIQVQGDSRSLPGRPPPAFGLASLYQYPSLAKMELNLSEVQGYALTAPMGHMDLSLWERFYLQGIAFTSGTLKELEYWPPHDPDVNQRGLSLPSVGLLAECTGLRRLVIHGTTHEHFMRFLLKIPELRDAQLREDYYPAPGDDNSTEMRVDSARRFEDAINSKFIAGRCD